MTTRIGLFITAITLWGAACQQIKILGSDSKPAQTTDSKGDSAITKSDRDERVDPPRNIIGHYLYCALEQEPSDAKAEALVGCRLGTTEEQRTPAAELGSSYHYSAGTVPDPNVVVYSKDLSSDKRYDAALLFIGPDRARVLEAARGTTIRLSITASKATGGDVLVGSKFREAERSVDSFPEARIDYAPVRDEILAGAKAGSGNSLPAGP